MIVAGAWDCHIHAFGPAEIYPPIPQRGYDAPDAPPAAYRAEADAVGLRRAVWVQPSIYGEDNTALLDALADGQPGDRGVVAPAPGWTPADLVALHARGVRGLRLNVMRPGGLDLDAVNALAPTLRDLRWHVAALIDACEPGLLEDLLAAMPVPVVLDHLGRPAKGSLTPDLAVATPLLRALEAGRLYVKLSAPYQISGGIVPWPDASRLAVAAIKARPDRVLFATNWPHIGCTEPFPPLRTLTGLRDAWCATAGVDPGVLDANAASLYD